MSNTARNDITGNWLKSKAPNDNYRNGFDAIFGKKEVPPVDIDTDYPSDEMMVELQKVADGKELVKLRNK